MADLPSLEAESGGHSPRRPGRRRDSGTDDAIVDATTRLVGNHGVAGLSVDAIAAAAGCSKTTIYRRWASKDELIIDALRWGDVPITVPDTGSLRSDLEHYYDILLRRLSKGRIDVLPHLVQSGMANEAVRASLDQFNTQREMPLRQVLQRGIARGELSPEIDCDTIVDALVGPLRYRNHFSGRKLDRAFVTGILDVIFSGLPQGSRPSPP